MIGEIVTHKIFGEGKIVNTHENKIYVQFDSGEKIFPYSSFRSFLTCKSQGLQQSILELANREQAKKDQLKRKEYRRLQRVRSG